jgi:serine/threonine-protein kinase SRPK3
MADFLQPMLRLVPEERATAAEMLRHPWLDDGCSGDKAKVVPESDAGEGRRHSGGSDHRGGGSRRVSRRGSGSSSAARGSSGGSSERESRSPRRHASSEPIPKRSR